MAQEYTVEQLNHGRKVWDFMRWDYWAFGISGFLLIVSIAIIGVRGFNWGLDFTGGTVIEITLEKPVDLDQMRDSLQKAGFEEPQVQNFGSSRDIMVRMPPVHDANGSQELGSKVVTVINESTSQNAAVKRIEFVGPSVGADLAQTGALALIAALVCILIYVGFRFEWRLAAGVVIALAHDVVITMGVLSLFHIEIDLTIVASLMSVIGYSLNDSIVVSDRIRENFRKIRRGTPYEIFNVSLTQTLHRTLITSGTTLMVILMLFLFGGPILEGFSLTMLIGVSIGTASSVYVASALALKLGMKREQVEKAIKEHPNAVAVLVNNPTYYGICSDLRAIVKMAHDAGMLCLADEAHGTHFYFGGGLPVSAMAAGADMASVSMHKSGGSLTQSSLLLIGPNVHPGYVRQIINLTQTTSGSYLLMSSLDISRRNLAQRGRQVFHQVADMAEYAREEINAVGGYYAFGKELCNGDSVFDFDTTKLSVHTLDIGLAGIEVYDILRDEYDIQIEFGDIGNILAYLSIGDRPQEVERLVSALAEIKRRYQTDGSGLLSQEYIDPVVAASPQEAFYAPKKSLPLRETEGMVCSEFVMCYPPGIPILAPGERITKEILNYIEYAKAKGCSMTGPEDPDILHLNVLA